MATIKGRGKQQIPPQPQYHIPFIDNAPHYPLPPIQMPPERWAPKVLYPNMNNPNGTQTSPIFGMPLRSRRRQVFGLASDATRERQ